MLHRPLLTVRVDAGDERGCCESVEDLRCKSGGGEKLGIDLGMSKTILEDKKKRRSDGMKH